MMSDKDLALSTKFTDKDRRYCLRLLRERRIIPDDLHKKFLALYDLESFLYSNDPLVLAYGDVCRAIGLLYDFFERPEHDQKVCDLPGSAFDAVYEMVNPAIGKPKGYPADMTLMAIRDFLALAIMVRKAKGLAPSDQTT